MKTKIYQTIPKANRNIVDTDARSTPLNTYIHIYMIAPSSGIINLRSSVVEHHRTFIKTTDIYVAIIASQRLRPACPL